MVTDKVTQAILICQKTSQSGILSTSLRMVHGKFEKNTHNKDTVLGFDKSWSYFAKQNNKSLF